MEGSLSSLGLIHKRKNVHAWVGFFWSFCNLVLNDVTCISDLVSPVLRQIYRNVVLIFHRTIVYPVLKAISVP